MSNIKQLEPDHYYYGLSMKTRFFSTHKNSKNYILVLYLKIEKLLVLYT